MTPKGAYNRALRIARHLRTRAEMQECVELLAWASAS
jgi:hypothetical protein